MMCTLCQSTVFAMLYFKVITDIHNIDQADCLNGGDLEQLHQH